MGGSGRSEEQVQLTAFSRIAGALQQQVTERCSRAEQS